VKLKPPGLGVAIFTAALLLRVGWILACWSKTGPTFEFPDEELHWQLASNLVNQATLVSDDGRYAARMPLYPLFLASFAWLNETGILMARLAQAVLGAATAWIAYSLTRKAFDRRAAAVAGALICFDPYAVFLANLLLTEVLFGCLALGLLACTWPLITHATRPARAATLGVAVLGAAAVMTRPSAAGWIVLLWIVLWLFDAQRWRAAGRLTLYLAVLAVCLLAWGLRNRAAIGASAWLSTNGGVTLYDALGPQADGSSNQEFLNNLPELAGLDEVGRDHKLRELALEQIRKDPTRALSLTWTKFLRTWSLRPNVSDYRGGAAGAVSAIFTAGVLLLALAGVVRAFIRRNRPAVEFRNRRRLHVLLWLPVIYFTLLHCVFIGSLRYRVPLMPFVEIVGATAFVQAQRERPAPS
jgi:4-amino-4-deoxy-L-arabinose transferase-like glycosyltransferase